MKGKSPGKAGDDSPAQSAARRAREVEYAASDDQTASDTDQTLSDADQTASERDEDDASRDQVASDIDQASADRDQKSADPPSEAAYEASSTAREIGTIGRLASHAQRSTTAKVRNATADARDDSARERDGLSSRRDAKAKSAEQAIVASDAPVIEKFERLRAQAAADRHRAAQDRARAAADRVRLQAEIHTAHLDELTGAYRREMGTLALQHEIDRARRTKDGFVVAFVDVDGIKHINDSEGHAVGDTVLKSLVGHMRTNLRSFDPIMRYGGDEFVAGLGGIGVAEVARRFAVIDREVRKDVGVGISVGIAELMPEETLESLTERADAALLEAKAAHRGE
ncbi:MAG TPA: GGDEF domain-containing protein [Candidatus Limnocylindria bacterium]|nr:GGDEF domain-containing protein [Candidatus Limnocylindria bacterium]